MDIRLEMLRLLRNLKAEPAHFLDSFLPAKGKESYERGYETGVGLVIAKLNTQTMKNKYMGEYVNASDALMQIEVPTPTKDPLLSMYGNGFTDALEDAHDMLDDEK